MTQQPDETSPDATAAADAEGSEPGPSGTDSSQDMFKVSPATYEVFEKGDSTPSETKDVRPGDGEDWVQN